MHQTRRQHKPLAKWQPPRWTKAEKKEKIPKYTPAELQTNKAVRIATLVDSAKPAMNANQIRAAQQAGEQKLRHEALQTREAEQKRQSDLVVQGLLQEMREREVKEATEAETKTDLDVQKFLTVARAFAPILQASIEESTAAHLLKEE